MRKVRPGRWRACAVLAALALVVAACGGDGGDDESADATTTIDVEVDDTTTSSMPATTTILSEADRFRTIAVDLWTARNDLYQNPPADPESALAEIFDRQCDCFALELDAIDLLIDRNVRYEASPAMPLGARFGGLDGSTGVASVGLALDATPRQLVGSDGQPVEERIGGVPYAVTLGLQEFDGRWRVFAVVPLQVDESFVDELIAEGLP